MQPLLTMHGVKLYQVRCALCCCQVVQVHDLELLLALKGDAERQPADPAAAVCASGRQAGRQASKHRDISGQTAGGKQDGSLDPGKRKEGGGQQHPLELTH